MHHQLNTKDEKTGRIKMRSAQITNKVRYVFILRVPVCVHCFYDETIVISSASERHEDNLITKL